MKTPGGLGESKKSRDGQYQIYPQKLETVHVKIL